VVVVTQVHHLGQRSPTPCAAIDASWKTERDANSVRPVAQPCRYLAKSAALLTSLPSGIAVAVVTPLAAARRSWRWNQSGPPIRRETVVRLLCCSAIWLATRTSLRCWIPKTCMPCWSDSSHSLMRPSTALAGRLTSTSATRQWRCSERRWLVVMIPSAPCAPLWRYRLPFRSSRPRPGFSFGCSYRYRDR
jgi:hypothetical protein